MVKITKEQFNCLSLFMSGEFDMAINIDKGINCNLYENLKVICNALIDCFVGVDTISVFEFNGEFDLPYYYYIENLSDNDEWVNLFNLKSDLGYFYYIENLKVHLKTNNGFLYEHQNVYNMYTIKLNVDMLKSFFVDLSYIDYKNCISKSNKNVSAINEAYIKNYKDFLEVNTIIDNWQNLFSYD